MIKRKTNKLPKISVLIIAGVLLSGCQMYNPVTESQLYPVKASLKQITVSETFALQSKPDINQLKNIANHYKKNSDGQMVLETNYAKNIKGQSERAVRASSKYKRLMSNYGVKNIHIEMIPHTAKSSKNDTLKILYRSWKAGAPIGCDDRHMPGYHGAEDPVKVNDYKMGCETETYISQMVARPKDLAGNDALGNSSSRREGNIIENNQAGIPNLALENSIQITNLGDGE